MDRPVVIAPSRRARVALGAIVGIALLVVTLSRVDLAVVADSIATVSLPGLALAVGVVLVDLAIRGLRWRALLDGLEGGAPVGLTRAVAYLTIGYLANVLLPARLGDLARAYLAGTAFQRSRLATLGTIVVERVADGLTMLGLAILSSLVVSGVATVQALTGYGLLLVAAAVGALAVAWWIAARTAAGESSFGRRVRDVAGRLAAGTTALRRPSGAATLVALTLGGTATAVTVAFLVARAVGIDLSPVEAALFMSAIALSLAIPAAPGSLGTYEFVGVVVLTSLGHSADRALATIVVMRAVSTFPPIALGIASTWVLHLRPRVILQAAGEEAAR
jgi:uncharacterized protein (TIRG00374 family)